MANNLTSQNIRREISEKLKQYRIRYPMTQKELPDKSGVSVRSISRFEGGRGYSIWESDQNTESVGFREKS